MLHPDIPDAPASVLREATCGCSLRRALPRSTTFPLRFSEGAQTACSIVEPVPRDQLNTWDREFCSISGPFPRHPTLMASALRRHHPFEPDRHSDMFQGSQGDIFGENPPGESNPRSVPESNPAIRTKSPINNRGQKTSHKQRRGSFHRVRNTLTRVRYGARDCPWTSRRNQAGGKRDGDPIQKQKLPALCDDPRR